MPKTQAKVDPDGAVAKAICELKAAADFIADVTDSYLGSNHLHQIADEAAEEAGLEITISDHHKSGATQTEQSDGNSHPR